MLTEEGDFCFHLCQLPPLLSDNPLQNSQNNLLKYKLKHQLPSSKSSPQEKSQFFSMSNKTLYHLTLTSPILSLAILTTFQDLQSHCLLRISGKCKALCLCSSFCLECSYRFPPQIAPFHLNCYEVTSSSTPYQNLTLYFSLYHFSMLYSIGICSYLSPCCHHLSLAHSQHLFEQMT